MFNDLTPAKNLELFNAAHAKICRHVKLYQDDVILLPVASGLRYQDLDPDILRIWSGYLYTGTNQYVQLLDWSMDAGDYQEFGWRGAATGQPFRGFVEGPKFGVDPTPNITTPTLAITGATSAKPIVLTVTHGLSSAGDGTQTNAVTVKNVGGLTSANGTWYAKVTGYSPTTCALYADQDLTIPVDGTGGPAYSSGGTMITTASYPYIQLYCQLRRTLATTDTMPAQILYFEAWLDQIALLWSSQRHRDQVPQFQAQAHQSLNRLSWEIMGRPVRLKPSSNYNSVSIRH